MLAKKAYHAALVQYITKLGRILDGLARRRPQMKKTHSITTLWGRSQSKKPDALSDWQLFLVFVHVFVVLVGLPVLMVVAVAFPSATSPPVNWKIATPFLVLFNGWYFYVFYRGVQAVRPRIKARLAA